MDSDRNDPGSTGSDVAVAHHGVSPMPGAPPARRDASRLERRIRRRRAALLDAHIEYVNALDEGSQWPAIVEAARRSGLPKEGLCRELSCAWSTIMRWRAGQSAPGPYAKAPIKAKLVRMMEEMRASEARLAGPDEPPWEAVSYLVLHGSRGAIFGAVQGEVRGIGTRIATTYEPGNADGVLAFGPLASDPWKKA